MTDEQYCPRCHTTVEEVFGVWVTPRIFRMLCASCKKDIRDAQLTKPAYTVDEEEDQV